MTRQLPLALSAAPEPSFENFIPGPNLELLERLGAAASGAQSESVIYLWGEPASGRTHLLRATVRAAGDGAAYLGCDADYALPAPPRIVAADDVERLDEHRQLALFALINRARDSGGTVLAAGSAPPPQLALRDDLKTRLGWGLVYRVEALRDEDKVQHLRAEAERRGLRLPDDVVGYLLARLPRDLHTLVAVLDRVDRHSLARQRPVTLALVREALRESDQ